MPEFSLPPVYVKGTNLATGNTTQATPSVDDIFFGSSIALTAILFTTCVSVIASMMCCAMVSKYKMIKRHYEQARQEQAMRALHERTVCSIEIPPISTPPLTHIYDSVSLNTYEEIEKTESSWL